MHVLPFPLSSAQGRRAFRPLLPPADNVTFAGQYTSQSILDVINASYHIGIEHCLSNLSFLISGLSPFYTTDFNLANVQALKACHAIFVWFNASRFLPFRIVAAQYVVVFSITCPSHLRSMAIAYTLMHFHELHAPLCRPKQSRIVAVSYSMSEYGAFGIMVFDKAFEGAFDNAMALCLRARDDSSEYMLHSRPFNLDLPVTHWNPPANKSPSTEAHINRILARARYVITPAMTHILSI
ncbi:hypothetical protein CVT24_000302 [Panaeolus cyanescens]|uniref:Uncharacterized protein n=1 Tax=Panaeolus cyanescens TaxID=181874 RepID=A0A409WSS0_9AGAR|nr:hypothetical protein CVT24_000302 [Panaeolus cyanescens]